MAEENPRAPLNFWWRAPWATFFLVGLMFLVFKVEERCVQWGMIDQLINDFAFSWDLFLSRPFDNAPRLISHVFLHMGMGHLVMNVAFFLVFAPAVERWMGSLFFLLCFMGWGALSALTQGVFTPFAGGGIGSSGAISGAAGAFFVLAPLRRSGWLWKILPFLLSLLWYLSQLLAGFRDLMPAPFVPNATPIAYWAHAGGFAAGALSTVPFLFSKAAGELA